MEQNNISDNKRIAFNTVVLYAKLIISIVVNFVSARLVLDALGASDYGLYNVVGGIVSMLNILGTSMIATSYRYMAVEIGKGVNGNPNKVYNSIFIIHLTLSLLLIIAGETIGVFYVNNYLNVDTSKIPDALFILHLSLLTTAFAVITIPVNGLIIAREKFLFTSVVESINYIIKILLIILLLYLDGNRLRIYAVFLAILQFTIPLCYQIYCRIKDKEVIRWNFNRNINDYKGIIGFSVWMLMGAVTIIGKMQGAAMIINYFFGTILNAAFGLATQVSNSVTQFTTTLRQAAVPQIMKNQGSGNEERANTLVYAISRYSYLCMNIMVIPLLLTMEDVLKIWLGTPPEYTDIYVTFMLINGMLANLGAGFDASIQATGQVKKNQIGYCLINISFLPIIFVLYLLGLPPYVNVIVISVLTIATLVFQIGIMVELTSFNVKHYIYKTIIPSIKSTILALVVLTPIRIITPHSLPFTILFLGLAVIWTILSIYLIGLLPNEKLMVNNFIKQKYINFNNKNNS